MKSASIPLGSERPKSVQDQYFHEFYKTVLALIRRQPGDVLDDDGHEEVHDQEVPEEDEDE